MTRRVLLHVFYLLSYSLQEFRCLRCAVPRQWWRPVPFRFTTSLRSIRYPTVIAWDVSSPIFEDRTKSPFRAPCLLPCQEDVIAMIRGKSHISVSDCAPFFYQWRARLEDRVRKTPPPAPGLPHLSENWWTSAERTALKDAYDECNGDCESAMGTCKVL